MPRRPPSINDAKRVVSRRIYEQSPERKAAQAFYGTSRWRRARAAQLAIEPLCRFCAEQGRGPVVATEADHIIDRRERPDLELDLSNLRSLCKPCHSRRGAIERGGVGR